MRNLIFLLAFAAFHSPPDFDSAVLFLSGASSLEELDETTLHHYQSLADHPLELNSAGRSRLLATGLFSPFQVASLLDWRERSGDLLSYVELGLLDGFTPELAEALKVFTRLESSRAPGKRRDTRFRQNLMFRGSVRGQDGAAAAGGFRYEAALGELAQFGWASRTTYSQPELHPGTLSAAYYGNRWLGKLILGHFNARFGQGLAIWSGFSMAPYSSVGSFRRNGSGFTPTTAFSPEHCGLAADINLGRSNIGAAYSVNEKLPMAHLSWCGRRLTFCVSGSSRSLSADFKLGLKNTGLFGEFAWNGAPSAIAGAIWIPTYGSRYGIRLSWKDGVPEAVLGAAAKGFDAVAALSSRQMRFMAKYAPEYNIGAAIFTPAIRLAARRTDAWRLEGRGETKLLLDRWALNSRLDVVHCSALSWLANAETGYSAPRLAIWLRGTLFCIDNWADRIYVYERDAPGTFNVPAYYGRGWSVSLTGAWKPSRRHRGNLRISYVEYPWMLTYKPAKAEVKLQYKISL